MRLPSPTVSARATSLDVVVVSLRAPNSPVNINLLGPWDQNNVLFFLGFSLDFLCNGRQEIGTSVNGTWSSFFEFQLGCNFAIVFVPLNATIMDIVRSWACKINCL